MSQGSVQTDVVPLQPGILLTESVLLGKEKGVSLSCNTFQLTMERRDGRLSSTGHYTTTNC